MPFALLQCTSTQHAEAVIEDARGSGLEASLRYRIFPDIVQVTAPTNEALDTWVAQHTDLVPPSSHNTTATTATRTSTSTGKAGTNKPNDSIRSLVYSGDHPFGGHGLYRPSRLASKGGPASADSKSSPMTTSPMKRTARTPFPASFSSTSLLGSQRGSLQQQQQQPQLHQPAQLQAGPSAIRDRLRGMMQELSRGMARRGKLAGASSSALSPTISLPLLLPSSLSDPISIPRHERVLLGELVPPATEQPLETRCRGA